MSSLPSRASIEITAKISVWISVWIKILPTMLTHETADKLLVRTAIKNHAKNQQHKDYNTLPLHSAKH